MTLKIGVFIPVTRVLYFEETLRSALAQQGCSPEIVVFNNAADGDVESVINKFGAKNIRYIKAKSRKPVIESWNTCLSSISSEWVIVLCDDDLLAPLACKKILERAAYHDCDVVHNRVAIIDQTGKQIQVGPALPETESLADFCYARYKYGRPQFLSDFAFRMSELRAVGGFVPIPGGWFADDATAIRLALKLNVVGATDYIGLNYRSYAGTASYRSRLPLVMQAVRTYKDWASKSIVNMLNREQKEDSISAELLLDALDKYCERVLLQAIAKSTIADLLSIYTKKAPMSISLPVLIRGLGRWAWIRGYVSYKL